MKYKVGDKVRVKEDLSHKEQYGEFGVMEDMENYKNKVATITQVDRARYRLDIDKDAPGGRWAWTDEMLEDIIEPTQSDLEKYKDLTRFLLKEIAAFNIEKYIDIDETLKILRPDLLELVKTKGKV